MEQTGLKLFKCMRNEKNEWEGAVIILAKNEHDACVFANNFDSPFYTKHNKYFITEIPLVEGFLYNDFMR